MKTWMDYDEVKNFEEKKRKQEKKILFSNEMDQLIKLWEQYNITMFRLQNALNNGQSRTI